MIMHSVAPQSYDLIEHSNADHARTVLIDWMLGNSCSYACSYCPKALHDGSVRWQSATDIIAFYDALHRHYMHHRGKQVWLQFTGGEPTMHPQILRVLENASTKGFKVSLISNASRTVRFWKKIVDYLDSVILTYHAEFAARDHFIAVANVLRGRMPMHINVTMHPDRFDKILRDAKALRKELPEATISLKPLRVGFGTELFDYTEAQRQIMSDGLPNAGRVDETTPRFTMTVSGAGLERPQSMRANDFLLRNEHHWSGYRCNAGLESLRVKADGRVTRAVCGVGGQLGRLGTPVTLPTTPITCTAQSCGCLADILITKTKARAFN